MYAWMDETLKNRHLKANEELFANRYPDIYEEILKNIRIDLPWGERLYRFIYKIYENPCCETCGNPTKFQGFAKGYARFCSPGCTSKNKNIKEQKRQTCMENYGVDNPSKSKIIQDKKVKTSRTRYGTDNPSQNPQIMEKIFATKLERYGDPNYNNLEKINETTLERYGVKFYMDSPDFRPKSETSKQERYGDPNYNNMDKNRETVMTKYGQEYYFQTQEFKDKTIKTNMDRYGCEIPMKCPEIQSKVKSTKLERYNDPYYTNRAQSWQTTIEHYGVPNPFLSPEIREIITNTNINKYGYPVASMNPDVAKKLSKSLRESWNKKTPEQRENMRLNSSLKTRPKDAVDSFIENNRMMYICECPHPECIQCTEKQYVIPSRIRANRKCYGLELCTKLSPIDNKIANTSLELFIRSILDDHKINYETNNRKILGGKELDIYIPEYKLAIECNGIYWHSQKEPKYHFNKWKQCKEQGIQLLTIWEDQIKNKPEIIRNIILSKLGIYEHKMGARECTIKEATNSEAQEFLSMYHLQGPVSGSVRLGLYYKDELISIMVFGRKRTALGNKKHDTWELYRYCTKAGWSVTGGSQKLLSHFIGLHPSTILESFSSNDISDGGLYERLGFTHVKTQPASYWYVDKYLVRHHRYTFRKDILVKNGADPNLTEFEITDGMGLLRIYDSGQQKWMLKINKN